MPRFVRRHENGDIEIFSVSGVTMVGRSRRNQVCIDDQSVSSTHAKVEFADGAWTLYDLESRNGTRINDAEIKVGKLKPGDTVRFGKIVVSFEADEAEPKKVSRAPEVKGIEVAPAAPAFGHTMAPFQAPAVAAAGVKPAEKKSDKPAVAAPVAKPSAAPKPAEAPKPPDPVVKLKSDQAELKLRVLKEQVRALQDQRLILMSIAAGLALATVIFLVFMLKYRNRALSAEHGIRVEESK